MRNLILTALFYLVCSITYAQVNNESMLKGKIISEDSTVVQYAHVYYEKDISMSTISNEEVFFFTKHIKYKSK